MRRGSPVLMALFATALAAGCDTPAPTESRAHEPATWELNAVPRVSIGVPDGDERYELVAVSSAFKQGDGTITIVDRAKAALLFYDSVGTFIRQAGRRGRVRATVRYRGGRAPLSGQM
jgi:hypothetical protein